MQIDTCHFEIHAHSFEIAKAFYVDRFGFELLQTIPAIGLLSVKAGGVRISIFANAAIEDIEAASKAGGGHIIFRTLNLKQTIEDLKKIGFEEPVVNEAPGFMKYVSVRDPSGNRLDIAEYLRDPLKAV